MNRKTSLVWMAAALACAAHATDGTWQGTTQHWSTPANWVGGQIATNGGTATFQSAPGVTTAVINDIPDLTLGGMFFSSPAWNISSASPINFAGDADTTNTIHVTSDNVRFSFQVGTGIGTLHKTGNGHLNLDSTTSLFTGRWLISSNRVEIKTGTTLMAEPTSLRPDAVTLNGGEIKNNDSSITFPQNMGITLGPDGGAFVIGWSAQHTVTFDSPITGPGQLKISRNNGSFFLANPANDYTGGTLVGTTTPGGHINLDDPTLSFAHLYLSNDGVLPYGPGVGGLTISGDHNGAVDLSGHSNRVTTLIATPGSVLFDSAPGTGLLVVDALDFSGILETGTRVNWTADGSLSLAIADGDGRGTIAAASGTVTAPLALGGATLLLDGAALTLDLPAGDEAALTVNSGILAVGPGGAALNLTGAPRPILLTGGVISPEGIPLTTDVPLIVGSPTTIPALFDADVTQPVTFRDRVWVHRLPSTTWDVEPGTTVILSGDALSSSAQFISDGAILCLVPENAGSLANSYTIATGNQLWIDTVALEDGFIVDSPANTMPVTSTIALDGGTLGLTGAGTVSLDGTITGNGHIVKTGTGAATLNGGNTFNGTITVTDGTLIAATATSLGAAGNTLTLDGGRLANAQDTDVTISHAITVTSGGFTVNGGSLTLGGNITLAGNILDKQGSGDLILDAATFTAPAGLTLTGGAVVYQTASGATAELTSLRGSGDLIVRGGGTLTVSADPSYTGRIILEDGTLLNTFAPATAPALWLDASAPGTLHFNGTGGITNWSDARPGATGRAWLNTEAPNYDPVNVPTAGFQTALAPTLIQNALADKPVVDFGAYKSGSWLEVTPVENTRTLFWVLGSQNGGGHLIGAVGLGTARGSSDVDARISHTDSLWHPDAWNGAPFRLSKNWLNGEHVDGTTASLSGDFDFITSALDTPVTIRALAKEGRLLPNVNNTGRSGGQRLAELIIYDRALTDDERIATEAYLARKWALPAADPSHAATLKGPALHVIGQGTVLTPDADTATAFSQITGDGTLIKSGDGTLIAEDPSTFPGTLALAEGTFTADGFAARLTADAATELPVPGAAFWADASAPDTFGTDANGRAYWRDARWDGTTDYITATQRWDIAPTLIPNAIGTLPVIDMGPTNTTVNKGLQWSRNLDNARTIFWLIGSQQGGGILLGGTDTSAPFDRAANAPAASVPIYSAIYANANIRNGLTHIDGIHADGTATGLNGGYQVIALRTTGGITVGQFAHDRNYSNRHGGQRLGEFIVYTNALSDAEMRAVEAYLMAKWQRPGTRGVPATLPHLDAPAEGQPPVTGTLAVDSRRLNVATLTGSGLLSKTGGAELSLSAIDAYSGRLTIESGRAILNGSVPRTPAFWVDASRTDTITLDPGTSDISHWDDCRDNGMYAEFRHINNKGHTETPPTLRANDLNGHPVVDFGKWMSGKHLSWSRDLTGIRTIFWVIGSQEGGGILLSYDRNTSTRHFLRAGQGEPPTGNLNIINKDNFIWTTQYRNDQLQTNEGQTRLNGLTVNGEATGLSGGYDVISLRTTGPAAASSFGNDRMLEYRNSSGGQRLAEVIVYEEALDDDEIRQVEAYLHAKWGIPTAPGNDLPTEPAASRMSLILRDGATLELGGTGHHALGTLGGTGHVTAGTLTAAGLDQSGAMTPTDALTLAGSLTLTAPADWQAEAGPAGIAPILAASPVTFQGGGTLTVTNARALPDTATLLLQGAPLTGFDPAAWTLITDDATRNYTLKAVGDALYLQPIAKGIILILK